MITIFNRTELLVTFDMEAQDRVRHILAQNNIEYDIKASTYGGNLNARYEYRIFVRKKDEEEATYLINKR